MKLVINEPPVAQSRPRFARIGKGVRTYEKADVKQYKQRVRQAYYHEFGRQKLPLNGSLAVSLTFYRPIQKSISRIEHDRRAQGTVRPTVKPDIDNYVKAVLDALNDVAFKDDNLIVQLEANKWYSDQPRTEIEIAEMEEF